jgi:hypothetical protein
MIIVKRATCPCGSIAGVPVPTLLAFLTLSTRNEGRKHQLFHCSHSVSVVGLLSLVLLRIDAEKRAAESPRSKAEVHHWKPAPAESSRTLADIYLVVEDIWYAARCSLSYTPIIDCQCVLTNHLRTNCLF